MIDKINPNDPFSNFELENIYCVARIESIALENAANNLQKDLQEFRVKTLNCWMP